MLVAGDPALVAAVAHHLPERALDVVGDVGTARARWPNARRVLVGPELCPALVRLRPPPRPGVAVLLPAPDVAPDGPPLDPAWPQAAVELGIERLLDLEDAANWLGTEPRPTGAAAERGPSPSRRLVVVTGSVGGVGATTLAVALAVVCSRARRRTLLLDLDPLGPGLDVVLGLEQVPGPRWPDLVVGDGDLGGLPAPATFPDLSVLAHAGESASTEPVSEVLAAAAGPDVVIVDLARREPPSSDLLEQASAVLLVSPLDVRGTAAAARRIPGLTRSGPPRLVARDRPGSSLSAGSVADALGLPLAGLLRHDRSLVRAGDRGALPGHRPRGRLGRLARALATDLGLLPTPHARRGGRRGSRR